mmetsp:Transcript_21902/g.38576  ORF Transcript_21902/g.38576 Transcript_21902/m.38576 type:complete len:122 (-) Transcript_21902:110-475(-)
MPAFLHYVDEDATAESTQHQLSKSPLSLVVAVASFAPKSKLLLRDIATLEKDHDNGSCCGPSPTKPDVFVIKTDASDELEELAIELGLNDVPSTRFTSMEVLWGHPLINHPASLWMPFVTS